MLLKKAITGKRFDIVYNMYQNIKSCVASEGKLSDFFVSNVGVLQGENLSPLLFYIYVDDLENYLSVNLKIEALFYYANKKVEVVQNFQYLGIVFSFNGKMWNA